jgi:hypothetical protein
MLREVLIFVSETIGMAEERDLEGLHMAVTMDKLPVGCCGERQR